MEIKEIKNIDTDEFYLKTILQKGSVFNSLEWLKIFGPKLKVYGIYNKDKQLTGCFNLYTDSVYGFKHIKNPPYTPHIGLCIINNSQNKAQSMSEEKNIINLIVDFIQKLKCTLITIAFDGKFIDMQPFIWNNFKVIPNYTYKLDLSLSIEALNKSMSSERRNDIARAKKDNITITETNDYDIVRTLVIKTFRGKEKALKQQYLDKIFYNFASDKNCFAFVAYKEEKAIATCFCVFDSNTAYYLLGGYDKDNNHHGAGAYCLWEAIRLSKEKGLKYFDFEGSMIKPVEKYFRGFGGDFKPYYTVNKAILPVELLLKFIKREIF